MTSHDKIRDFAVRYTAAWCSGKPETVAAHYAPDGRLTINDGEPAKGREAITEVARSFMSAFPDMRVLMDDIVAGDDGIRYHWTLIGTNAGPGGKGKRVHIQGFEDWTLADDGLIARSEGHFDQAEYDRQLEHGVHGSGDA